MRKIPWAESISRALCGRVAVCSPDITKEHDWAGLMMLDIVIAVVCQKCAHTPMEILEKHLIVREV